MPEQAHLASLTRCNHKDAIASFLNLSKPEQAVIQKHQHGKGEERRISADHLPVVASIKPRYDT